MRHGARRPYETQANNFNYGYQNIDFFGSVARRMKSRLTNFIAGAVLCGGFGPAFGGQSLPCRLCSAAGQQPGKMAEPRQIPLRITIETMLDFSRVAQSAGQGGAVEIDPRDGGKRVVGNLIDLGGMSLRGTAIVTGEPNAPIRIDIPGDIQLRSAAGATAQLADIKTNLSVAPRLDGDGRLSFSFGGKLVVKGPLSGNFRGRIPITAEYD
jgi:Domain of unknown function (DUF4402)